MFYQNTSVDKFSMTVQKETKSNLEFDYLYYLVICTVKFEQI